MTAKNILKEVVEFGHMVTQYYVSDLSDAELLVRSVPGSNHIAWQMGHMIISTHHMLKGLGHSAPDLPAGFAEAYTAETSGIRRSKKVRHQGGISCLGRTDEGGEPEGHRRHAGKHAGSARPGIDARVCSDRGLGAYDIGEPLADALRPIRAHPPEAGEKTAVLTTQIIIDSSV